MTQPIRLRRVSERKMVTWITPLVGIMAMQISQSVPVVRANDWNFAHVAGDQFLRTDTPEGVVWEVVIEANPFTEVIPSWTGRAQSGASLSFELSPEGTGTYQLGRWSEGEAQTSGRTSIKDQKDDFAAVYTDTLVLKNPATRMKVTVRGAKGSDGEIPHLNKLSLILSPVNPKAGPAVLPLHGTLLDVPLRAQMSYEGGNVLCSPTSVSMILSYWAKRMETPSLDHDVPLVQRGVFDPGWDGTGNWSFNVAFAGSLPGMTAYVTRLREISDIEKFVASGVPVATSVSYGLLKGKPKVDRNDGHLVVIVGFEADGTPIFNDPGRNIVRLTYPRVDFERAWANSKNTVYIIHPKGWNTPQNGPWPERSES